MRHLHQRLSLAAVLVLAGCGDKDTSSPPEPLAITSRSPAPGTHAHAGVTVTVRFNQPIDPATLTPATLQVGQGGVALPVALSYDAATHTVSAGAPFLPESTYEVEVTSGVHMPTGSGLGAPDVWSFTTLSWHPAISVDAAGQVGLYSSVAAEASGRVHVSYYDYSSGDLKYATCSSACAEPPSWDTVTVDAPGLVGRSTSIAVDGAGRVHLAYQDVTNTAVKYATCATVCATAPNWETVTVDAQGDVGYHTSVAVDGSGRVHLTYQDLTSVGYGHLKYATCASACTTAANWETVTVDAQGDVGYHTSVAVDGSGRVHVGHRDDQNAALKYATCAAACSTAANWVTVPVYKLGPVGYSPSLTVDSRGGVHVGNYAFAGGAFRYATCATACSTMADWDTVTVDTPGSTNNAAVSLAVDEARRVHVIYYDTRIADFSYATCAAACTTPASWRATPVYARGSSSSYSSLAVDEAGRVHVSFYDESSADLKYIE